MVSWEYLAGMIDADGSIGTTRTGKNRNVVGRVVVVNTNHDFLRKIQKEFGGYLTLKNAGGKANWKPFGCLTWTNRKAEVILENVLPHLLIKRLQGSLVLELIKMRDKTKSERYVYIPRKIGAYPVLKPEVREKELQIASCINVLNQRGV